MPADGLRELLRSWEKNREGTQYEDQLETGILMGELEIASWKVPAGRARFAAVEKEAVAKGYKLVARKAREALAVDAQQTQK